MKIILGAVIAFGLTISGASAKSFNEIKDLKVESIQNVSNDFLKYVCFNKKGECLQLEDSDIAAFKKENINMHMYNGFFIAPLGSEDSAIFFKDYNKVNEFMETGKLSGTNVTYDNFYTYPYLAFYEEQIFDIAKTTSSLAMLNSAVHKFANMDIVKDVLNANCGSDISISISNDSVVKQVNAISFTMNYNELLNNLIENKDYDNLATLSFFVKGIISEKHYNKGMLKGLSPEKKLMLWLQNQLRFIEEKKAKKESFFESTKVIDRYVCSPNYSTDRISGTQSKVQKDFFFALSVGDIEKAKKILDNNFDFTLKAIENISK